MTHGNGWMGIGLALAVAGCPSQDDDPMGGTDSGSTGTSAGPATADAPTVEPETTGQSQSGTTGEPETTTGSDTMDAGSTTGDPSGSTGDTMPDGPPPECVAMVEAANAFLDSLDAAQQEQATFAWDDPVRQGFEFLPPNSAPRDGLSMRDMSMEQVELLQAFLQASLSNPGYLQVEAIRALESVLAMQEEGVPVTDNRDPDNYFIHIFGTPDAQSEVPWGWRFEGHHLSVHASVIACAQFSATPAFWGVAGATDPMQDEIDLSQQLWDALDADQQNQANVGVGTDAIDAKTGQIDPIAMVGLPAGEMTADQQDILRALVGEYVGNAHDLAAEQRLAAIEEAGFENVWFAWAANTGNFRVLGPTFVIEFVWAGGGHVHSVWRNYDGDYGDDLIERHMSAHHHPRGLSHPHH